jgi:pimeloyl-ACP methyl ester carboxylesterase
MKTLSGETLEDWFNGGDHLTINLPGHQQKVRLFYRVQGSGPWLTLLHGFPTCSWDWQKIAAPLAQQHRLLLIDLLGYGDSEKPAHHHYSCFEHVDIIEALWRHFGIEETSILAHDVGCTLTQELLARQKEGQAQTRMLTAILLNFAPYIDHYHPVLIAQLMRQPLIGPILSKGMNERSFTRGLSRLFSEQHPLSAADAHQYWLAMERHQGASNMYRLVHYIGEKKRYRQRWENALENSTVDLHFLWGMADPVTGTEIAEDIRHHLPSPNLVTYHGISHFPHLEIPEQVIQDIDAAFLCSPAPPTEG